MRRSPRLFRLTAGVALSALLGNILPLSAVAQQSLPPLPPAPGVSVPDQAQTDPPARVGRVAQVSGQVSFRNQGDTQWSPASTNYPVSSGNSFWTEPSATALLDIADNRIALAGQSELTINTLDASGVQAVVAQGESYYHLRALAPNEVWTLLTPRGTVRLTTPGRYGIVVGTTEQPTLVTVIEGAAQIDAPNVALTVNAGQTASITGTDPFQGSIGPVIRSAFLAKQMEAERPRPPVSLPRQVVAMPGSEDLATTGSWTEVPDYGQVWYPPVQAGWVPYREGHWAYVAPWGWTWVDNASWGFAPFHYGRWIELGGRWAWTPGVVTVAAPPVYAPALVTFIGIGAGVALGAALTSGAIGWVPLGPREPYHPWYHASPDYVRQVNITHVSNVTTINNVTVNNFINRGAATAAPVTALTQSRPVQALALPVTPQQLATARPIVGQQPIRPSPVTAGITPIVARQLNLGPAPMARPAPGPIVRAGQDQPGVAAPNARPPLPGLGAPAPHGPAAAPGAIQPPGTPVPPGHPGQPQGGVTMPLAGPAPHAPPANTPLPNGHAASVPPNASMPAAPAGGGPAARAEGTPPPGSAAALPRPGETSHAETSHAGPTPPVPSLGSRPAGLPEPEQHHAVMPPHPAQGAPGGTAAAAQPPAGHALPAPVAHVPPNAAPVPAAPMTVHPEPPRSVAMPEPRRAPVAAPQPQPAPAPSPHIAAQPAAPHFAAPPPPAPHPSPAPPPHAEAHAEARGGHERPPNQH